MLPDRGPFRGHEGARRFWSLWAESLDEFRAEPEDYVEAGDSVVVRAHMVGRGKDSGVPVETPSFPTVWTAREDAIVRVEMFSTTEEALAAVGLPPDAAFKRF